MHSSHADFTTLKLRQIIITYYVDWSCFLKEGKGGTSVIWYMWCGMECLRNRKSCEMLVSPIEKHKGATHNGCLNVLWLMGCGLLISVVGGIAEPRRGVGLELRFRVCYEAIRPCLLQGSIAFIHICIIKA